MLTRKSLILTIVLMLSSAHLAIAAPSTISVGDFQVVTDAYELVGRGFPVCYVQTKPDIRSAILIVSNTRTITFLSIGFFASKNTTTGLRYPNHPIQMQIEDGEVYSVDEYNLKGEPAIALLKGLSQGKIITVRYWLSEVQDPRVWTFSGQGFREAMRILETVCPSK